MKNFLVRKFIFHCVGWFILLFSKRNQRKEKTNVHGDFDFQGRYIEAGVVWRLCGIADSFTLIFS
jgi:hypothetical protein